LLSLGAAGSIQVTPSSAKARKANPLSLIKRGMKTDFEIPFKVISGVFYALGFQ
jgi:hypothetical protein